MDLTPVQKEDLTVGQPLPWDLFDQESKQLLERGYVIGTTEELEKLADAGMFRDAKALSESTDKKPQYIFDDMKLRVGNRLQLNLLSDKESYSVSLIGYVQDVSLMVVLPLSTQLAGLQLIEGDQVRIRLFSGQCAFSFTVFVKKIIRVPFQYMHLSFPDKILGQTIRKSRRIKTNITATVSSDESIPITITDLSTTGAKISTNPSIGEPGTTITLSFTVTIHGEDTPLSLKSNIKSSINSQEGDQDIATLGIEFADLKSDQIFTLQNLIYQEIVECPNRVI